MKQYLKVGKSQTHGQGLFSTRKIIKGATIGKCRVKETKEPGQHTILVNETHAYEVLCRFRYINHSKKPNVVFFDDFDVIALKDIKDGDELFHDYGDDWN